jgi:hypothetical protein
VKRSTLITIVIIVVVLLVLVGLVLFLNRNQNPPASTTEQGGTTPTSAVISLDNVAKPQSISRSYKGCPASGDGGDPVLNTLKNRVDENNWQPTTVQQLLTLQWPHGIEQQPRSKWSPFDKAEIARYEGAPVQVIGYFVSSKRQGPESCNCHSTTDKDYHIWMTDDPNKTRQEGIVVETTPRVSAFHSGWTGTAFGQIVRNKMKVRVSGWLLMDPEHPDQVGKTRGTIWEIHPIMQIETLESGTWRPLDNGTTGVKSAPVDVSASTGSGQAVATAPPITPVGTASPAPPGSTNAQFNGAVQITSVNYDGVKSREPDEYIEITNEGTQPVEITDWTLQDPTGRDEYKWEGYTMKPGEKIRVYTNEVHKDTGGFTFGSGNALWPNSGGIVELYDADHQLVSRSTYGKK